MGTNCAYLVAATDNQEKVSAIPSKHLKAIPFNFLNFNSFNQSKSAFNEENKALTNFLSIKSDFGHLKNKVNLAFNQIQMLTLCTINFYESNNYLHFFSVLIL